jgi:cob(I)alamin adenosyltransferase
MSSITTKVGDHGTTFLFSGEEVPKDSPRTEAYGDIDELVSVLGVARAQAGDGYVRETLFWVQVELFVVATELATEKKHLALVRERMDAARLALLETRRSDLEGKIKMPTGFIIPGGTPVAAVIDHARTIARRCERKAVGLARDGVIDNKNLLIWLNRLSDFLWLLARYEEGDATVLKP